MLREITLSHEIPVEQLNKVVCLAYHHTAIFLV